MKINHSVFVKEFLCQAIATGTLFFLLMSCTGHNTFSDKYTSTIPDTGYQQSRISAYDLHKILTAHFGHVRIKLSDSSYFLPDNEKVILLSAPSRYSLYGVNKALRANWDCDDYTIAAMAPMRNYAFGAMYITTTTGAHHVINVFVNNKREVVYWEPQTCSCYRGQFYTPELIIF